MSTSPPREVVEAIEDGTTHVTRRVEFYEYDGETRWDPEMDEESSSRLIEGGVSVDYTRDERRSLDVKLDNRDSLLRPNAVNGLWYDKIIKCFRGVRYPVSKKPPPIAIVEEDASQASYELRSILMKLGFNNTDVKVGATALSQVRDYDILISYMRQGKTAKSTFLQQAFNSGKKVVTVGIGNTEAEIPLITAGSPAISMEWGLNPPTHDTPLAGGWDAEAGPVLTGYRPGAVAGAGSMVVAYLDAALTYPAALIKESASGGRWLHFQRSEFGTQAQYLLRNGLNWLRDYQPYKNWETQVGEFMIDNLREPHFPHHLSITGRDYTKKCLLSKLEHNMAFEVGTPLDELVRALAANAGIKKFKIPRSNVVLEERIDLERGTPRWEVMKNACTSHNIELFFDPQGYLTMREFIDPSFGALSWTFQTGLDGNIATFDRSTNDSRIFNHIFVTGEREGEDNALPYFGEAINNEPSSPTRVDRLGDRSKEYTSSFFTSNQQCRELARAMLKVHALESYEINWQSFNYSWLEAGEIVKFLDPNRTVTEPTRYLMDTLSIPMGLGPMSATGKRVTFVDDTGLQGVEVPVLEEA